MHAFLLRAAVVCAVAALVTSFPPTTTAADVAFTSASSALVTAGTASDPGDELWVDRFDEGWDSASSIGVSPDGDTVYVTGASGTLNFRHYLTIAYDAMTGARLWVARYGEPPRDRNLATSLGVSPDGTKVYVTGGVLLENSYGTVAYDAATGTELWVALLEGDLPQTSRSVPTVPK